MKELAADCTREFDSFRAPLSAEDRERRKPSTLTCRQRGNLDSWGYPYVMDDFRFHMTLTGKLPVDRLGRILEILRERFAALDLKTFSVDRIAVFRQNEAASRFRIVKNYNLNLFAVSTPETN